MNRRQQIEAMLEQDGTDSFLRYALALEWASEGQPNQAMAEFNKLLTQDPGYIPAYLQAGQLLAKAGQGDAARILLEKGIHVARQGNDDHAAEEMAAILASLPPS